jgi:hypothetical protein
MEYQAVSDQIPRYHKMKKTIAELGSLKNEGQSEGKVRLPNPIVDCAHNSHVHSVVLTVHLGAAIKPLRVGAPGLSTPRSKSNFTKESTVYRSRP